MIWDLAKVAAVMVLALIIGTIVGFNMQTWQLQKRLADCEGLR